MTLTEPDLSAAEPSTAPAEPTIAPAEKKADPGPRKEPLERCYRAGGCLPDQPAGTTPAHFGH